MFIFKTICERMIINTPDKQEKKTKVVNDKIENNKRCAKEFIKNYPIVTLEISKKYPQLLKDQEIKDIISKLVNNFNTEEKTDIMDISSEINLKTEVTFVNLIGNEESLTPLNIE
ncbi:hypothetical protein [Rickettsia endosymbiont of Pantilius tunicatus]|uniref:hypothetical protein n=1 Tax=Rickettsia endosymbiont of Pantilius tunicatus TaxID=3066267 RepID=UPI0030E03327